MRNNNLSLQATIERAKQTVPKVAKNNQASSYSDRIKDLCNRIASMPKFSLQEFIKVTKIGDQTFRSWRVNGVKNPHVTNLESLRQYIKATEEAFHAYLSGKITLDELWVQHLNSDSVDSINIDSLVSSFRLLSLEDKLRFISTCTPIISEEYQSLSPVSEYEIEFVELSTKARKRLKELLKVSLTYTGKTMAGLIKEGIPGDLLTSIDEESNDSYEKTVFMQVLPYLCAPIQWVGDLPLPDPGTRLGGELDELLRELNE